jgi:hypothetical protein
MLRAVPFKRIDSAMDIPTPMCRACGVDRELVRVERANAKFDVPHFRCPQCHHTLRVAVRHHEQPEGRGDHLY